MEEQDWIRQAQHGDINAFNELVLSHQDQAYHLAYRMLHDDAAAQDAVQEAFISAYQHIRSFRGGSFKAWMFRIVKNKCLDQLRVNKRKPSQPLTATNAEGDEWEDPIWLEDDKQLPEQEILQKEVAAAIQQCIDQLPEQFRLTVILVDVQGLNYKQAAKIASAPVGTIRSRLARARVKIQSCLQHFTELLPRKFRLKNRSLS